MSNIPSAETTQFIASIWRGSVGEAERLAAADAILKLAPRSTMDEAMVRAARELRAKVKLAPTASD